MSAVLALLAVAAIAAAVLVPALWFGRPALPPAPGPEDAVDRSDDTGGDDDGGGGGGPPRPPRTPPPGPPAPGLDWDAFDAARERWGRRERV